mmetsp:Transcript_43873/g.129901  ORF Transcript_43873/g.129901 Transcript_43873/m.129901 type:complete len:328 (+) Transcript_43873:1291-2274(+)
MRISSTLLEHRPCWVCSSSSVLACCPTMPRSFSISVSKVLIALSCEPRRLSKAFAMASRTPCTSLRPSSPRPPPPASCRSSTVLHFARSETISTSSRVFSFLSSSTSLARCSFSASSFSESRLPSSEAPSSRPCSDSMRARSASKAVAPALAAPTSCAGSEGTAGRCSSSSMLSRSLLCFSCSSSMSLQRAARVMRISRRSWFASLVRSLAPVQPVPALGEGSRMAAGLLSIWCWTLAMALLVSAAAASAASNRRLTSATLSRAPAPAASAASSWRWTSATVFSSCFCTSAAAFRASAPAASATSACFRTSAAAFWTSAPAASAASD